MNGDVDACDDKNNGVMRVCTNNHMSTMMILRMMIIMRLLRELMHSLVIIMHKTHMMTVLRLMVMKMQMQLAMTLCSLL